jgi:hypothetical protein
LEIVIGDATIREDRDVAPTLLGRARKASGFRKSRDEWQSRLTPPIQSPRWLNGLGWALIPELRARTAD